MNSKIKNAEDLLYASQNGYDRLMNEVHHDGNTKENRIAAEERSAIYPVYKGGDSYEPPPFT